MKPVEQQVVDAKTGDCTAACIASILEMDLADVPNLHDDRPWVQRWNDWLKPINLRLVRLPVEHEYLIEGYAICTAWSPRFPGTTHAVVWHGETIMHPDPEKAREGWMKNTGHVAWDPSPKRDMGIGAICEFHVFQVIEPSKSWRESA